MGMTPIQLERIYNEWIKFKQSQEADPMDIGDELDG